MSVDLFSCKNKVAVVTGGNGLLGKAIVQGLADFGGKVYIADVSRNGVEAIIGKTAVKYIHLDISSERDIKKVFSVIYKKERRVDILVNCAYPRTRDWMNRVEQISSKSWNKNVNGHLGGYFFSCRTAAEIMKKQKSGTIINFASIYAITAPDFGLYEGTNMTMPAAYAAIKSGIIGCTRYLASYYGKYNIRVNTVSPGGIFNNQAQKFVKRYSAKTLLGKMATPQDVVGAVIYLASDAAKYVTGTNLLIDGGLTSL